MHGTLRERKCGGWEVEISYAVDSEPIRRTVAWKVYAAPSGAARLVDGMELRSGCGDGWDALGVTVLTEQEGRVTEEPILPPRTKCQTRYERGRWEVHHRTRGWIAAAA